MNLHDAIINLPAPKPNLKDLPQNDPIKCFRIGHRVAINDAAELALQKPIFDAINTLKNNMRDPSRGVEALGVYDNNETRKAIAILISNTDA